MNTDETWAHADITPSTIEAIVRQARAERAEVMRASLAELPALIKRAVINFRPIRERALHKGALA